ncbi:MAG: hypothetical protein J6Z17_02030 [Treponema sp.]|nr:hypothetical protein [Treponema sp.]
MESELKTLAPNLFKNSLVQPNFAEALRILYVNTKSIGDLLSATICTEDITHNLKYAEQLLLTGFDSDAQEVLSRINYETRKHDAHEAKSVNRYFEAEHKELENVIRRLNTDPFIRIDRVINKIKQLNDICRYNYITVLRLFDGNFQGTPGYMPQFSAVPIEVLETALLDLYYVLADMDISVSLKNALLAIYQLATRKTLTESRASSGIEESLKKIQGVIKNVLKKDVLLAMIQLAKKDETYNPQKAVYENAARREYADYLEEKFRVDEKRLKAEIQDETISEKVNDLFPGQQLIFTTGYSSDLNNLLRQSTPHSFNFILPLQVLKTFIRRFYEDGVRSLLNDIVIEGFFNNPSYKTDFSTAVFSCNEILDHISNFESMFQRGNDFDEAQITGLVHDSHRDASFGPRLKELIERINRTAKDLIQIEANNLNQLYKKLGDIIVESKKPTSEIITNLKILMISSRNRDKAELLDDQYSHWKIFLEIMKNYVIIGNVEKK